MTRKVVRRLCFVVGKFQPFLEKMWIFFKFHYILSFYNDGDPFPFTSTILSNMFLSAVQYLYHRSVEITIKYIKFWLC